MASVLPTERCRNPHAVATERKVEGFPGSVLARPGQNDTLAPRDTLRTCNRPAQPSDEEAPGRPTAAIPDPCGA